MIGEDQRRLEGFDEKTAVLYAKVMTTRDIKGVLKVFYGVEVSPAIISQISAELDAGVAAWSERQFDSFWSIVCLVGMLVHVRGDNGRLAQHTM